MATWQTREAAARRAHFWMYVYRFTHSTRSSAGGKFLQGDETKNSISCGLCAAL
jgi:hypothetical protein